MSAPSMGHTPEAAAAVAALAAELAETTGHDIQATTMFGMPSIRHRGGKSFVGSYGDDLLFKLDGAEHARALDLDGAHLFEPMPGRAMRQWVVVPRRHAALYGELGRAAAEGVA